MIRSPNDNKNEAEGVRAVVGLDKGMNTWFKPNLDKGRLREAMKLVTSDKLIREGEHWIVRSSRGSKD